MPPSPHQYETKTFNNTTFFTELKKGFFSSLEQFPLPQQVAVWFGNAFTDVSWNVRAFWSNLCPPKNTCVYFYPIPHLAPFVCWALQQKLSPSPLSFGISCDCARCCFWLSGPWLLLPLPVQSCGWCWSCSDLVSSLSPCSSSWGKAAAGGGGTLLRIRWKRRGLCHGRPWEWGQKGSKVGKIKTGMKNECVTQPSFGGSGGSGWICAGLALLLHQGNTRGLGKPLQWYQADKTQLPFPIILILILAKPLSFPDLSSKPD